MVLARVCVSLLLLLPLMALAQSVSGRISGTIVDQQDAAIPGAKVLLLNEATSEGQFRSEFYNILNHTQFDGVDNTARFDAQGNQINARFGQITSARAAREVQFSPRLVF